jgi:hypothetical protein
MFVVIYIIAARIEIIVSHVYACQCILIYECMLLNSMYVFALFIYCCVSLLVPNESVPSIDNGRTGDTITKK